MKTTLIQLSIGFMIALGIGCNPDKMLEEPVVECQECDLAIDTLERQLYLITEIDADSFGIYPVSFTASGNLEPTSSTIYENCPNKAITDFNLYSFVEADAKLFELCDWPGYNSIQLENMDYVAHCFPELNDTVQVDIWSFWKTYSVETKDTLALAPCEAYPISLDFRSIDSTFFYRDCEYKLTEITDSTFLAMETGFCLLATDAIHPSSITGDKYARLLGENIFLKPTVRHHYKISGNMMTVQNDSTESILTFYW
jgi:hypothetical protein